MRAHGCSDLRINISGLFALKSEGWALFGFYLPLCLSATPSFLSFGLFASLSLPVSLSNSPSLSVSLSILLAWGDALEEACMRHGCFAHCRHDLASRAISGEAVAAVAPSGATSHVARKRAMQLGRMTDAV